MDNWALFVSCAVLTAVAGCGSETSASAPNAARQSGAAEAPVAPAAVAAPTPAATSTTAGPDEPFPIKTGFYTYPELTCAQAMGSPPRGITITREFWRDIDADYDLQPVRKLGEGRYRMGDFTIRVVSADEIVADEGQETETPLRWCTDKEL